jgi:hypothetical protein
MVNDLKALVFMTAISAGHLLHGFDQRWQGCLNGTAACVDTHCASRVRVDAGSRDTATAATRVV